MTAVESRNHGNEYIHWITVVVARARDYQSAPVTSGQRTVQNRESSANLTADMATRSIGHMCRVHAYSQDARVCTCIDAVNVQGCVKEAQNRKEENRFDWLILVCDVQPWLLSHLQ